ncbi:MAG: hypothetical protein OEV94_03670 [Deltaproteobacteria bacterium]|nr:hypothetical protein [Deltaproteobacteria bacterium]
MDGMDRLTQQGKDLLNEHLEQAVLGLQAQVGLIPPGQGEAWEAVDVSAISSESAAPDRA